MTDVESWRNPISLVSKALSLERKGTQKIPPKMANSGPDVVPFSTCPTNQCRLSLFNFENVLRVYRRQGLEATFEARKSVGK
jgi:hypothetical protein